MAALTAEVTSIPGLDAPRAAWRIEVKSMAELELEPEDSSELSADEVELMVNPSFSLA